MFHALLSVLPELDLLVVEVLAESTSQDNPDVGIGDHFEDINCLSRFNIILVDLFQVGSLLLLNDFKKFKELVFIEVGRDGLSFLLPKLVAFQQHDGASKEGVEQTLVQGVLFKIFVLGHIQLVYEVRISNQLRY